MLKSFEQIFFVPNGGGDNDGDYTVDLLIYYTLGDAITAPTFDYMAFGKNYTDGIQDDVIAAIKKREPDFCLSRRVNVLNKRRELNPQLI